MKQELLLATRRSWRKCADDSAAQRWARRMIRPVILATMLIAPLATQAQQPAAPQTQAMQQTIIKLTGEALDWQTQALTLQRQVDDLTKQLADVKKPAPEAPKP